MAGSCWETAYQPNPCRVRQDSLPSTLDILFQVSCPITWLAYDPKESLMNYNKVHMGSGSDIILRSSG
jgi:hypothetical protein